MDNLSKLFELLKKQKWNCGNNNSIFFTFLENGFKFKFSGKIIEYDFIVDKKTKKTEKRERFDGLVRMLDTEQYKWVSLDLNINQINELYNIIVNTTQIKEVDVDVDSMIELALTRKPPKKEVIKDDKEKNKN